MKFLISRTSEWRNGKPYKNAYYDNFVRVDERVVDDPSKLKHARDRETWYDRGSNHRVENRYIKRDFEDVGWFIDIDSLEELIELMKDVGEELVITESHSNNKILEIEIYDDYRE